MMGIYIDDWTGLVGQVVCIRRNGRLIRVGQVEAVTPSGDVLWLQQEGVEPRALFQKVDSYTAWTITNSTLEEVPIVHVFLNQEQCVEWPSTSIVQNGEV